MLPTNCLVVSLIFIHCFLEHRQESCQRGILWTVLLSFTQEAHSSEETDTSTYANINTDPSFFLSEEDMEDCEEESEQEDSAVEFSQEEL